ncbi:MAG: class F sortase [Pseudonocardiales bacterium]|nr:MAG: class F sortase [Pseudonocardiales bacterium]
MRLVKSGHRTRNTLIAAAILLAVVGVTLLLVGLNAQDHAPQPPASAAGTYAAGPHTTATPGHSPTPLVAGPRGPILPRSTPTRLSIPAIGVDSTLIQLGLNADRTVQVPPLGADSKAGWYRYSPSPGQLGPSILLGHIDSAKYGPGVFYKLGALRKGNTVSVRRADNTVAVFSIDAVVKYPKDQFPTLTVYGNTDHAALRLITCGGKFDFSAHSYEDNIVAFASLISSHKA